MWKWYKVSEVSGGDGVCQERGSVPVSVPGAVGAAEAEAEAEAAEELEAGQVRSLFDIEPSI
jgi:hypothetical protein